MTVNVTLEIGAAGSEVVSVTAEAQVMNRESGASSQTITERQIQDVPLSNRSVLDLAVTVANVSGDAGSEDPDGFMGRWARWFNPKRRRSQMSNKKWILGAAVVVAAVIAFVALRNPNRQSNAEGTIGAAHRYQSQQVSGSDVSLDNPQVASFLQSDAFRKLAANPAFRAAAKSDAFARVIGSEELRMASAKYNMAKILEDAHVQELLKNEAFMKAMTDARIGEGLKQADLAHLLDAAHLPDLLKLDAVRQLALKGDFVRLAGDAARAGVSNAADLAKLDSYKTLKDDAAYKTLEGNKYYTEALQYGFLDLFRTPEGAAFAVEGLRQLSESAHLAEALKVEGEVLSSYARLQGPARKRVDVLEEGKTKV